VGIDPRVKALLLCALACASCSRSGDETGAQPPAPASAPDVPRDTTKPGEIAEGTEQAFGLLLPRDMVVTARLPDAVYATGNLPLVPLTNYVRERLLSQRVDTGPEKTVFAGAAIKADPTRRVEVEVLSRRGKVQVVVRDRTPPPQVPGLSEEERWRRAGLTPKGKVIDKEAE
jgi:hypothetical protein